MPKADPSAGKPRPPRIQVRDIDLARDLVYDKAGRRITQEYVDDIIEEVSRMRGRPSLSRTGGRSPSIAFRLTPALRARAEAVAAAEGKTLSDLAREALEERLRSA
jgi:predicted HicB family RNase H-like nuclease